MKNYKTTFALGGLLFLGAISLSQADPCLVVTMTGTMGGPGTFNGLAGSGTLVRYGDETNECNDLRLQFDAGRGTNVRLSSLGVTPAALSAMFFTHMHSGHADGFADTLQNRWNFASAALALDVACAVDSLS